MQHKKDFQYANAFKPLSPCPSKKGGGRSLFEMYHGLKKKISVSKGGRRKLSKKKNNSRTKVSLKKKRSLSKRRLSRNKQRGGDRFPKNPPYMLSKAPHKQGETNLVAPTSLSLYERSFQGPFPSISGVQFKLERPCETNNLLVEPSPLLTGGKKKGKVVRKASKKVARKVSKKVVRKVSKKVVRKASKKVARKASKKVVRKASKKVARKTTKKSKRRIMRGG